MSCVPFQGPPLSKDMVYKGCRSKHSRLVGWTCTTSWDEMVYGVFILMSSLVPTARLTETTHGAFGWSSSTHKVKAGSCPQTAQDVADFWCVNSRTWWTTGTVDLYYLHLVVAFPLVQFICYIYQWYDHMNTPGIFGHIVIFWLYELMRTESGTTDWFVIDFEKQTTSAVYIKFRKYFAFGMGHPCWPLMMYSVLTLRDVAHEKGHSYNLHCDHFLTTNHKSPQPCLPKNYVHANSKYDTFERNVTSSR